MTTKHPKFQGSDTDRDIDPGIDRSKGSYMTGEDPKLLDGDSTFEGDVTNETTREGGIDPNKVGRTNK